MSTNNPRGVNTLSDKFVSSLEKKKALKPLITPPSKKVKTLKVCSLSELPNMGFVSAGTGIQRDAAHHLWNVEKTSDGYSLIRNAEEDSDDSEDHSDDSEEEKKLDHQEEEAHRRRKDVMHQGDDTSKNKLRKCKECGESKSLGQFYNDEICWDCADEIEERNADKESSKTAAEGDLTQCTKCQEIFPKAESACPSCGAKTDVKTADEDNPIDLSEFDGDDENALTPQFGGVPADKDESLQDQVKRLRDQALEYFSTRTKIVPDEEDILYDVINAIEEESGQDVYDEMFEHIRRILLSPDDEETERWSSADKKAGTNEENEYDEYADEEGRGRIDTGDPDYKPKYWIGAAPEAKENNRLWEKLVPGSGEAETPHGELLRAINRLQYDRYNNGFGNGPFTEFNNTLLENEANIKKFMGDPSKFDEFEREFEDINLGKDVVDTWAGDSLMDDVMDGVVAYVSSVDTETDPGLQGLATKKALVNPALEKSPEDKEEIETTWGERALLPLTEEENKEFYENAENRDILEGPQEKPYKLEEDETKAEEKLPKATKANRTMTAGDYQDALPKMRQMWDNTFDENDRYDFLDMVGGSDLDVDKSFDELPLSIQDSLVSSYHDVHQDIDEPSEEDVYENLGINMPVMNASKKEATSEEMAQGVMDEIASIEAISKHELTIDMFRIINNYLPDVTTNEELYEALLLMDPEDIDALHEQLIILQHREGEAGTEQDLFNRDYAPGEIKQSSEKQAYGDELDEIMSKLDKKVQEMAETYINGNISVAKKWVGSSIKRCNALRRALAELGEQNLDSFDRIMGN
jgi:hypothetical protein